jgi:plasmid stabilization system protein ParE
MRPYRFVTPAYKNLRDILDYLNSNSSSAAERFLATLDYRLRLLAKHPLSGQERPEFGHPELRYLSGGSYLVAYYPATKPLTITAIVHGARDVAELMKDVR